MFVVVVLVVVVSFVLQSSPSLQAPVDAHCYFVDVDVVDVCQPEVVDKRCVLLVANEKRTTSQKKKKTGKQRRYKKILAFIFESLKFHLLQICDENTLRPCSLVR